MRAWHHLRLILIPSLLIGSVVAVSGCAEAHPSPLKVMVALGTDDRDFGRDEVISAFAETFDEPFMVLINGNPRAVNRHGGLLMEVNQWLQPGRNTLTVRGPRSDTLYLEIATHQHDRVRQILKRKKIEPDDREQVTVEFEIGPKQELPDHPLPRILHPHRQIPEDDQRRQRAPKELARWMEQLDEALQQREGEKVARKLLAGQLEWSPKYYKTSQSRIESLLEHTARRFSSETFKADPIDIDSLRFEFGSGVVMVYRDFDDERPYRPYLTRAEIDGEPNLLPPLLMAPADDGWLVWQFGDQRATTRPRR